MNQEKLSEENNKRLEVLMNEIKELIDSRVDTKAEPLSMITSLAGVLVGLAVGKLGSRTGNENAREFLISVLNNIKSEEHFNQKFLN